MVTSLPVPAADEVTAPQVVEAIEGHCTCSMRVGDAFYLRSGKLSLPAGRDFCLYALQAAIPLLPAKQRQRARGRALGGCVGAEHAEAARRLGAANAARRVRGELSEHRRRALRVPGAGRAVAVP